MTEKSVVVTKDAIVTSIASKTGLKKVQAEAAYKAALETITESLSAGNDIRLSGIGSLHVKFAAERQSRNPKTGEPCVVPARREVRFRASEELKRSVASSAEGVAA